MGKKVKIEEQNERWNGKWSAFWSGWLIFFIGFFWIVVAQIIAVVILAVMSISQSQSELSEAEIIALFLDGDSIGIAFLFALPLTIITLFTVVKFRRKMTFANYVGLQLVKVGELIRWLTYLAIFAIVAVSCEKIVGRPPAPEWMKAAYDSTDYVWLFFVSVVILGPITEELLYRGYIQRVWSQSKLGIMGSIMMVSFIWAGTHFQYDLYDMTWIVLFGVILGISRLKTGSIIPAIAMHMSWNAISLISMVMTHSV